MGIKNDNDKLLMLWFEVINKLINGMLLLDIILIVLIVILVRDMM